MITHEKSQETAQGTQNSQNLSLLYTTTVPCGFPSPAEDYIESPLDLNEKLIYKPSATFFVRVRGQSMNPTILEGDLLVIDRSRESINNSIVLAVVDGEFTVKRYVTKSHGFSLIADNEKFKEISTETASEIQIWGVVIHAIRSF